MPIVLPEAASAGGIDAAGFASFSGQDLLSLLSMGSEPWSFSAAIG